MLNAIPIIVDSTGDPRSASLARALIEYGFNVRFCTIGLNFDGKRDDLIWLKENHPEVKVLNDLSSDLLNYRDKFEESLSIGFPTGYAMNSRHVIPFDTPFLDFGFYGIKTLMHKMRTAYRTQADYGKIVAESEVWKK